ncbi:hypothetical protein COMA2_80015 [Candidatus Nitrospira nitrificans]|uniref:Uncharacterized protein n=1 Tax=Candidatus Nitrospira nitrificans TaxID=1742973 RepID=A0A0S4LRB4_9BACT|nr:hypothetical protein COMA2_80015 [Candidatus Nitrospira nitrificans]
MHRPHDSFPFPTSVKSAVLPNTSRRFLISAALHNANQVKSDLAGLKFMEAALAFQFPLSATKHHSSRSSIRQG